MKILVTGTKGFIGKKLYAELEKNGHEIVPFDIEQGDLSCENALNALEHINFVYHLAAKTFVPESWDAPFSFFETNIMGTATVLEFCRRRGIPLVMPSTYMYGTPQYLPIDEAHPISAPSPYHMGKQICENLCEFYARAYGLNIRVLRIFNVYGPGQSEEFLLPKIMHQVLSPETETIEVFDLAPKRDYIYIEDVLNALALAQKPWRGYEILNIGSGESLSVKEAIEIILRETESEKTFRETGNPRPNEIPDTRADIKKAREVLGFVPKFTFEQGVRRWLKEAKRVAFQG